MYMNTKEEKNS